MRTKNPTFLQQADITTDANKELNRRQFLCRLGVSTGAGLLATQGIAQDLTVKTTDKTSDKNDSMQLTKDDLPTALTDVNRSIASKSRCIHPIIETRLFASSNVGGSHERNQLALERLACAGFDVHNPAITERQYLRFAGTDTQRASDLQNIATGAIAVPKLLMGVRGGYGAMRLLLLIVLLQC